MTETTPHWPSRSLLADLLEGIGIDGFWRVICAETMLDRMDESAAREGV
jgi:hypothetical protein